MTCPRCEEIDRLEEHYFDTICNRCSIVFSEPQNYNIAGLGKVKQVLFISEIRDNEFILPRIQWN